MKIERDIGDHFLAVLILGFAFLVLLLGLAVYVAVGVMYPAETRAVERAGRERAAAQMIDGIHRNEDSLNRIFYELASRGREADRVNLLRRLDLVEAALTATLASGSKAGGDSQWAALQSAAGEFIEEGRRVLHSKQGPGSTFYEKHEALNTAVAELATTVFAAEREADRREAERSAQRIQYTVVLLGVALVVAIFAAGLAVYVTRRTVLRARWQAAELGLLSSRAMSDLDALARRFSRELHDQFGQTLTAMEANLVAMQNRHQYDEGRIEDCLGLIKDGISHVREVSQLLRPSILDDFGLDASLRWLGETFAERTGIQVSYESSFPERMDTETETQVFRIAQEAITNVGRHSGATTVRMQLRRVGNMIRLTVADNGRGIAPGVAEGGLGLVGMRARARTAGGILMVVPGHGRGVTVLLEVPYAAEVR